MFGYLGMNLDEVVKLAIIPVVPKRAITLHIFYEQAVDNQGNVSVSYLPYPAVAQVQLEELGQVKFGANQHISHHNQLNLTKIYYRFYIQSYTLTGLNRNLSEGGDYIEMDSLFYKIVEVRDNFRTGWVRVTGTESTAKGLG